VIDLAEFGLEQLPVFPGPEQLCLPEQLTLPVAPAERGSVPDAVPSGVEPVEPPDAPAALECVARVLTESCAALDVTTPRVRWYRPAGGPGIFDEGSYWWVRGFHYPGERVIWLHVGYASAQDLATTVAHEVVHYWQDRRRGRYLDEVEHAEREREARRRAHLLVPKGTFPTPRGRKRDAWFTPARR
jgi:hypothetical protein